MLVKFWIGTQRGLFCMGDSIWLKVDAAKDTAALGSSDLQRVYQDQLYLVTGVGNAMEGVDCNGRRPRLQ